MVKLRQALAAHKTEVKNKAPKDVLAVMEKATINLRASGIESKALLTGDKIPNFTLPNQHGVARRFNDYLARGPVVLNIYRGGWCPYCNLEMRALHQVLPEIKKRGAQLVAMSPETPEKAEQTSKRNEIDIDILSDSGNRVSAQLGLVFELPEELRPIYEKFGIDIPGYNGDRTFKLPVPATYIISRDGIIRHHFVNADYTDRLEPAEILAALDAIRE